MTIYERDENKAPDSEFDPGSMDRLVPGNRGRLLDYRRTPVTLIEVRPTSGAFVVRLDAFEDKGGTWEIPFENVTQYQFEKGASRLDEAQAVEYEAVAKRLDQRLRVAAEETARAKTLIELEQRQIDAERWLEAHSRFLASGAALPDPATRLGAPDLYFDLQSWMQTRRLEDMETAFARRFVSNPYSGDMVRGHRIVIAECGLAAYDDKVPRDPAVFDKPWTHESRRLHVLGRLAFLRALFSLLGTTELILYRGFATEGKIEPPRNETFVSTTFAREVALSHIERDEPEVTRVFRRQSVPVERVFMTYLETEAMNAHYREAEAVLLFEVGNERF